MNNQIIKTTHDISGPSISGTVTVALSDLDKMRADHARLKAIASDLEAHQMEVKVTLSESKYTPTTDNYGRWTNNYDYKEIGHEYRNLDDVREVVRQQVREEFKVKTKELQDKADTYASKYDKFKKSSDERDAELRKILTEANTKATALEFEKVRLTDALEFNEASFNQLAADLDETMAILYKERKAKSWIKRIFG